MPENLVSRDGFGSPVSRQPAHLHTQAESRAYLRDSSRVSRRRPFIYLRRHTPSDQSRVYRVTQLRTDGVHCRESAGTGPVNLKVVPNECCLGRSPWTNSYTPLFPTPTIELIDQLECDLSGLLLRTLTVSRRRRQQPESIEVALVVE